MNVQHQDISSFFRLRLRVVMDGVKALEDFEMGDDGGVLSFTDVLSCL